MNEKQKPTVLDNTEESMIDARQASYALHLPYYWFATPKMRAAKRIPHYQLALGAIPHVRAYGMASPECHPKW